MKIFFPFEKDYIDFCDYLSDLSKTRKNITIHEGGAIEIEEFGASFYES